MHHPSVLLTAALLSALLEDGFSLFVRQSFPEGFNSADVNTKEVFLITPYKDIASANAHFQTIRFDRRKYIYRSHHQEEVDKLYTAASQPPGYRIYVALIPVPADTAEEI
ncbi:hypothetical protein [Chitinophaga solisilvae]|uniref:Uncharacterized protein n=1 Tax=Chitinophaga solisilvae TaxID=1233460 RepID=A0A9Q5DA36_9BACT|nr:hypothetical protein [Chitinophaga solisilvae]NSL90404.1 hypothetical protein [Chitinophaga solisilvae]